MPPFIVIIDPDIYSSQVTKAGIERSTESASSTIIVVPQARWPLPGDRFPDVVIIDPSPYSLIGVDLIQRLRECSPDTSIIVLASASTPSLKFILSELKVDVYLEKPTALPILINQLDRLLTQRKHLAPPCL